MPDEMTLDEYDKIAAEPEKKEETPNPSAELQAQLDAAKEALRVSEAARRAIRDSASTPPPPTPPEQPKRLTREELTDLMQNDPAAALEYVHQQSVEEVTRQFEARVGPIAASAATTVEKDARSRYPTEFELFGEDIQKELANIPDKSLMTNPQVWDQLVSYVRGKSGNLEKLVEHEIAKRSGSARNDQHASAGFSVSSSARVIPESNGGGNYGLDAIEREIADKLGQSYAEYAKWKQMGG
jgi:hypothetical protein